MESMTNNQAPTKEQIAIVELRQRISDVILANAKFDDDLYLLQWLIGQKLNPGKAEEMIRNSIKWREEKNIHSNFTEGFSAEFLKGHLVSYGKTKDGIPVAHVHLGRMDMKSGIATYGKSEWARFWGMVFAHWEDKMIEFNKTTNKNIQRLTSGSTQGMVCLLDVQDFCSTQPLDAEILSSCVEVVGHLAHRFPGIAANLIYYNMNPNFRMVFAAIEPFLTWPNLTVEVYDETDENICRNRILQMVSLEDLDEFESHWK